MALPLILGGAMAGASLLGGIFGNAQAKEQYEKQVENIKLSLNKQWGQLQEQARQENDNAAMEMATARFEGLKATATTGSVMAERNLAGNTAARAFNQSLVNRTMAHNALAKKAEDDMVSYGSAMEAKRDEATQAIYGASAQLSANTKSTLSMATSAVGAGVSGYMMGTTLGGVFSPSTMGSAAGGAGGFTSYEAAAKANYSGGF